MPFGILINSESFTTSMVHNFFNLKSDFIMHLQQWKYRKYFDHIVVVLYLLTHWNHCVNVINYSKDHKSIKCDFHRKVQQ